MKNLLFNIAIIAGLAALGSCGPNPTTAPPSPVSTAASTAAASTVRVPGTLLLATTTSTQDSGLLDVILPVFEKQYNVKVKVVAVGTGQAIKLGTDGNADVVLVHARAQEDEFVRAGDGINRRDVMYNDFIIVGPASDPAKIAGLKSAGDAVKKIAAAQSPFASRGDKSGTNTKELDIWKAAGIEPKGAWYLSVGQGMGETLTLSNEKLAYTLSDRATWFAQKSRLPDLTVLVGGNSIEENADQANLFNPYGVIPVNPARHPQVNADLGEKFAQWITSLETQQLIARYGLDKFGQSQFRPSSDAWKKANP
jgi:tungstate transport system substrate-binding protein